MGKRKDFPQLVVEYPVLQGFEGGSPPYGLFPTDTEQTLKMPRKLLQGIFNKVLKKEF